MVLLLRVKQRSSPKTLSSARDWHRSSSATRWRPPSPRIPRTVFSTSWILTRTPCSLRPAAICRSVTSAKLGSRADPTLANQQRCKRLCCWTATTCKQQQPSNVQKHSTPCCAQVRTATSRRLRTSQQRMKAEPSVDSAVDAGTSLDANAPETGTKRGHHRVAAKTVGWTCGS